MPASEREAGRLWGSRGTAEQSTDDADILAERDEGSKQAASLGRCVCGTPIGSRITGVHCPTCAAWRRWFSAHRVATCAAEVAQ